MDEQLLLELKKFLEKSSSEMIDKVKSYVLQKNKFATGNLYRSFNYKIVKAAKDIAILVNYADYGDVVDKGRRPGAKMPPEAPIKKWCQIKGIPETAVYSIRKSISDNGIKGINFSKIINQEIHKIDTKIEEDFSTVIAKYIELELEKGIKK